VLGQDNLLRYLPCSSLLLLATPDGSTLALASACAAALLAGNGWQLSGEASAGAAGSSRFVQDFQALVAACGCAARIEPSGELGARLAGIERLRWLGPASREVPDALLRPAGQVGCHVVTRPVLGSGRYELLFNHREQAISSDYHRYGHLGWRSEGLAPQLSSLKMNSNATFSPNGPAARGP